MSSYYPNIPRDSSDKRFAPSVVDALRQNNAKTQELEARVSSLTKQVSTPQQTVFDPSQLTTSQLQQLATLLQPELSSTGTAPQTIEQMIGVAAQPQMAGVQYFPSAPPNTDPTAQDGTLILVGPTPSTASLMRWDSSTTPSPILKSVASSGGGSSTYQSLVTSTVFISQANTLNGQNTGVITLPAAGFLNTIGKAIKITCGGAFQVNNSANMFIFLYASPSPTTNPPTGASAFIIGSFTNPTGFTTGVTMPWRMQMEYVTQATGASGKFAAIGEFASQSSPGGQSRVQNVQTPVGPLVDLTQLYDIVIVIRFDSQPASSPFNAFSTTYFSVELIN